MPTLATSVAADAPLFENYIWNVPPSFSTPRILEKWAPFGLFAIALIVLLRRSQVFPPSRLKIHQMVRLFAHSSNAFFEKVIREQALGLHRSWQMLTVPCWHTVSPLPDSFHLDH